MNGDDRNDRKPKERLSSWREVDKIRSSSRDRERDPMLKQSSPAAMNAQKNYRAALEKAFAAGTLGELAQKLTRSTVEETRPAPGSRPGRPVVAEAPAAAAPEEAHAPAAPTAAPRDPDRENRQKLLARIKDAEGREPITRAIDAFLAKYPKLPDDYEILTKALSHKNDDRVTECLEQLTRMCAKEKPRRGRALVAQLRFLEDTHSDADVRTRAAAVRGRL